MKRLFFFAAFFLLAGFHSQGTAISSTSTGGSWGSAATWVGGVIPTSADAVTIVDGATVTIDGIGTTAPECLTLTVGQGTTGILQYTSSSSGSACTLTIFGNQSTGDALILKTGSIFKIASGGTGSFAHRLNIGGDVYYYLNSTGTLNLATVTGTGGSTTVATTFTGNPTTQWIYPISSGTCIFNTVQINGTTNIDHNVTINGNLQVGDGVSAGGILQFLNSNSTALTLNVLGSITIPSTGGIFRATSSQIYTVAHTLIVGGNIIVNGDPSTSVFNLTNSSTVVNTTIAVSSTVSGNGTAIFNTLAVNDNATVTLGIASLSCTKLTVGTGSTGATLQYVSSGTQACSLSVGSGGLIIGAGTSPGSTIKIASTGTGNLAHSLSVTGGNITFNGTTAGGINLTTVTGTGTTTVNSTISGTSAISGGTTLTCKFNDLSIANGATVTIGRSFTCNGNLNIGGGSSGTLQYGSASSGIAASTVTVGGNINMTSGSSFKTASGGAGTYAHNLSVGGSVLFGGGTGTINFTTVNNATVATTVTGATSTISGSAVTPIFNTLTVANGGVLTVGSSIICNNLLTVGGGTSGICQFNSTAGGTTVTITAGNGLTVAAGGKLIIEPTGTLSAVHSLAVTGNITVSGTSTPTGLNLTSAGTTSVNTTINGGSSNVTFSSTNTAACTFNNLTVANAATTLSRNVIINGDLTVNNGSTLDLSTFTMNGIAGKKITLAGTAALKLAGNTGGQAGSNFPSGFTLFGDGISSTTSFSLTSTVEYNAGSAQSPQTIYQAPVYGNLTLSSSAGNSTGTAGGALTISGDLNIGLNSTFDAGSFSHNIGGSWTNNGVFAAGSSSVTFNSSTTGKTIGGSSTTTFNIFTLNKTDNTKTITVAVDMNANGPVSLTSGKLILSGGTTSFNQSSGAIAVGTNAIVQVSSPGTLTISNVDLLVNGGFLLGSGIVNIGVTGSSAIEISGNTSSTIFNMQNGALNIGGCFRNSAFGAAAVTFAGGSMTVCQGALNDASRAVFELDANSVFTQSGGTIILQNKNQGSGGDVMISSGSGSKVFNSGFFQFGNSSTFSGTLFNCRSEVPLWYVSLGTNTVQANINLLNDLRLLSGLALNRGVVTTNNYSVIIPSTANLSTARTPQSSQESYINGNLIYRFVLNGSGSNSFNSRFEVGDTYYAPIDPGLTYSYNFAFSTNVDLIGSSKTGIDPNDAAPTYPAGVNPINRANHYWALGYSSTTGGTFSTVSSNPTFNFNGAGIDATGNPSNYIVAKYDNVWSNPNVGVVTTTSTQATGLTSFSNFEVGEACALPLLSTTVTNILCHGNSNGSVTLSVNGGTPPFVFGWSNGATTSNINNVTAGTYFVTVTSATGCGAITSVTITQPALLAASCGGTNLTCHGSNNGSASATVIGGTLPFAYLWNNGSTVSSIANLQPATYYVTVTDFCGAANSCSYTVANPPALSAICGGSNVTCIGAGNGTASVTAAGGTTPYSYLWSNGGTLSYISNLQPQSYFVTVTDFCGVVTSGTFTVSNPSPISVITNSSNISCHGVSNGSAAIIVTGGTTPYNYNWSNGVAISSISNLTSGFYSVTVTDNCAVTGTTTLSITEPSTLSAFCTGNNGCHGANNGTTAVFSAGGTTSYSYLWSNGRTEFQNFNLQPQTYTVTVTDSKGCTFSCSYSVVDPPALAVSASANPNSICANNTINLTATISGGTPTYYYAWTGPAGFSATTVNSTVNASSAAYSGTYSFTVTDGNGCTASSTTNVTVTNCPTTLNLKLYIQGYYAGSGLMKSVMLREGVAGATTPQTDTILVSLRNATTPTISVDSVKSILMRNGTATALLSYTIAGGSYYIAIKHRNGIETWSKNPVAFTLLTSYDFTTADTMAYGSNMVQVDFSPKRWAFYNGDMNPSQDGNIDLIDFPILDFGINNGLFGYYKSDLNGDGNTDLLDFPILDANINSGIFLKHP